VIRLFVALPIPDRFRPGLSLMAGGLPGARWVRPENLHLTLRFIGNTDGRTYADVMDVLAGVKAPAFDLALKGIGHFGERGRVDSLWVGVAKGEALMRLHDKIETALQRIGLDPEHRRFLPHVTLARLKSAPAPRVADWMAAHGGFVTTSWRVEGFDLFSSYLGGEGAIYQREAGFPLGGAGR